MNRLMETVRNYVMNKPQYPGVSFAELFPDWAFPSDSEHDKIKSKYLGDSSTKINSYIYTTHILRIDTNPEIFVF